MSASPSAKRQAKQPRVVKILDWQVLETRFKACKVRRDAIGNWMFRNKKFDKATAAIFIDLYRELKKEGFE
ncbi:MAG: hypothetical protein Q6373_024480 [Candidatus Sigynarchaeota archaeon]